MTAGIFSPYFATLGGGERYVLTVAEFLLNRGDKVIIFDNGQLDKEKVLERFGIDVSRAEIRKKLSTFGFDWFFFLSDGSIPFSFARKNILHFQVPFHYLGMKNFWNRWKLGRFNHVVCNSNFTKSFIDKTYGVESEILYPPVDVYLFSSGKKENIILSVGRFLSPLNPKKQEVLVEAFIKGKFTGWQLVLIGGGNAESFKVSDGKNIKVIINSDLNTLKDYYSRAKIYWHAAGFGEDLNAYPEKAEHFGISTVEAMAAGCVPIVFSGGGQVEIVKDKVNGFLWQSVDQLVALTRKIIGNDTQRRWMAKEAIARSRMFSKQKFFEGLERML